MKGLKTYSNKSNAKRAIKAIGDYAVRYADQLITAEGKEFSVNLDAAEAIQAAFVTGNHSFCPACGGQALVAFEDLDQDVQATLTKEGRNTEQHCLECGHEFGELVSSRKGAAPRNRSSIENPCAFVWDKATEMKGARRKDVIEACVNAGVNFYTARTQYQLWKQAGSAKKDG